MTLRSQVLEKVLQKTRPLLADLGLRQNSLSLVVRSWTGKPGATGSAATDSEAVEIFPIPRIRQLSSREVASSGGRYQDGDLRVDRLSPKHPGGGYDPEDLRPSVGQNQEIVYLVTGPNEGEHELVDFDSSQNFQYVLVLRRRRTTPFKGS
jgi:hypothetical protein